jgi:hypothetical protein
MGTMTLHRVQILSPNYSSRGGAGVRLIVIHASEGATTYQSLGNFFANPSSGVSSHTGIDDTLGTIGEYVTRDMKAWTAAGANPVSVQTELCVPSGASNGWSTADWISHPNMLVNTAEWIKEEAAAFGIPIVRLTPEQAQSNGRGVCEHRDLGSWGGGHSDCGPNFPIDSVIAVAQGGTVPPIPAEEDDVFPPCAFTRDDNSQHAFYINSSGQMVHSYYVPGNPWRTEGLAHGWDPKSGVVYDPSGGNDRVWGMLANGKGAQCYWSGKAWTTQALP